VARYPLAGVCSVQIVATRTDEQRTYMREYMAEYRKRKPEKALEWSRKHHENNKEKRLAAAREYKKKKRAEMTALQRKRHCGQLQRTPKWADQRAIKAVYKQCAALRKETGIRYEVDHIIPLQGEFVSGLHVASNLQILTKTENLKKNNGFPE
jgi:hypothetical protein